MLQDFQTRVLRKMEQRDAQSADSPTLREAGALADLATGAGSSSGSDAGGSSRDASSSGGGSAGLNGAQPEAGSSSRGAMPEHTAHSHNERHANGAGPLQEGGREAALNGAACSEQAVRRTELSKMLARDLRALCEDHGLPQYGTKRVLVQRLLDQEGGRMHANAVAR